MKYKTNEEGGDNMSNDILTLNNIGVTSSLEQLCTCDKSLKSSDSSFDFNSILSSEESEETLTDNINYSLLTYGVSNVPTGIVSNIYSNINENLNVRNELISSINTSELPSNSVEITNTNLTQKEQIEDAVKKVSQKYGVDANLIKSVIKTESNFNPNAVSGAGAKGLMQIMPSNFKNLGISDPFNIYQNVEGGTKLLKEYIDKYDGDVEMALMAYNGGPTRMKNRGVTSIEHIYKMPKETQNYVKKVMKYYKGE